MTGSHQAPDASSATHIRDEYGWRRLSFVLAISILQPSAMRGAPTNSMYLSATALPARTRFELQVPNVRGCSRGRMLRVEDADRNSIEILPFLLCSKSLICLSPFNKILLVIIIK